MTISEIQAWLQQRQSGKVKFAFADVDGVLRGKIISVQKLLDVLEHGSGFCDVVFGWDVNDQLYAEEVKLTGWHTGFPDQFCRIDLHTFRNIPWQNEMPFFIADFEGSKAGEQACPRSLLKRIAAQAAAMGYVPKYAQEFEWFNFSETPASLANKNYSDPTPLTPGMFGYSVLRPSQHYDYNKALFDQLTSFAVPLEGLHTETGPGVYEAAIHHDSVLAAADKAVLFKAGVKEIASQFGIMASFMAKWNQRLPGCSGHIHQSLWDEGQQRNLFYDESAPNHMSQLQQHFVAGLLYCLPHVMPMYAPTVNSYKRLVEGAWAPTTISWGIENRTAAVRIINHYEKGARAELRVPGSDSNPYLAMAAALASGLYGIRNQIPLRLKMTEGNAYAAEHNLPLHRTLIDATHAMQQSTIAREILGSDFVEHFTTTRLHEWQQYSKAVTDWELKRYFEII